jgi:lysophospholipase L1-like esterase
MTRRKASGHSNQALFISGPSMFGRRQMRSGFLRLRTAKFAIAVAFASWPAFAQTVPGWTTAWGTSQQGLGQTRVSNATLRLIARVTVPGDAIRLRFDNTFGTAPVTFGKVSAGPRQSANNPASISPGLLMPVMFAGQPSVTIAAGGSVTSDTIALRVDAQQDLAVSVYIPGADVPASQHSGALVTSFITDNGAGDLTASESGTPFKTRITTMPWLKAIDVRTTAPTTAIVAFGDSITDGSCTTLDAHDRWQDIVAQRLALQNTVRHSVVNEGIGGNTVTRNVTPPPDSTPGTERLDRDVLAHAGVSHVVVFMGTNDIRREASAEQVINGLKDIAARVKARGLKVIGVTIVPRHNVAPVAGNTGWNDAKTKVRNEVNAWIRRGGAFDGIIDFDRVVRSAANPDLLHVTHNCDGIHPTSLGYFQMGKSVDLNLFETK